MAVFPGGMWRQSSAFARAIASCDPSRPMWAVPTFVTTPTSGSATPVR
jgi:hypothetical protein